MEQQQISPKKQKALDKVKRVNAELAKIVREENVIDTCKRQVLFHILEVVNFFIDVYI